MLEAITDIQPVNMTAEESSTVSDECLNAATNYLSEFLRNTTALGIKQAILDEGCNASTSIGRAKDRTNHVDRKLNGPISKRIAYYLKTRFGLKLSQIVMDTLTNKLLKEALFSTQYYYRILDPPFEWTRGEFGDDYSCFFSERPQAKLALEQSNIVKVLQLFTKISNTEIDKHQNKRMVPSLILDAGNDESYASLARCWLIQETAAKAENNFLCINGYGMTLNHQARILASIYDATYEKRCIMFNGTFDDGSLYVNRNDDGFGSGYLIGPKADDGSVETTHYKRDKGTKLDNENSRINIIMHVPNRDEVDDECNEDPTIECYCCGEYYTEEDITELPRLNTNGNPSYYRAVCTNCIEDDNGVERCARTSNYYLEGSCVVVDFGRYVSDISYATLNILADKFHYDDVDDQWYSIERWNDILAERLEEEESSDEPASADVPF